MSKALATIKCDVDIDYDAHDFTFDEPDVATLAAFYKELNLTKLLKKL